VTVLFRPFPWEVRSFTQALAALETTVLGFASVWAGWSVFTGRAKFNRTPLTMTALTYVGLFSVAFVSLGNFGLLVRQRMQVVGFLLLVLFSVQMVLRDFGSSSDEKSHADLHGQGSSHS
jgi:TRAP-type C4-dicarboxylate transport system permease small subunit